MKRVFCLVISLLIILVFLVNAFSANIDGIDSGIEWDDAVAYKLVDGESNCGVNFGLVKAKFDNESSAVFLCFMFIDPTLEPDNQNAGVLVSLDGSSFFELNANNSPTNADINKYSFDGAMLIDENNGVTCEIRIGIKDGLPRSINGEVRFVDANGEPSNLYSFLLINEGYTEPTELEIAPTKDNTDPYYNSDATNKKTTKKRTTEGKVYTEKRTTRKPKTTTKATTRWTLKDSPMIYTGRTKTEKVTKQKAEIKQSILDTPNGVTVYYYEKEIYISQVFVTQEYRESTSVTSAKTISSAVISTDLTATSSESTTLPSLSTTAISLSKGTKLKKISVIIGAAAFCLIAALGVYFAKKSKSETD